MARPPTSSILVALRVVALTGANLPLHMRAHHHLIKNDVFNFAVADSKISICQLRIAEYSVVLFILNRTPGFVLALGYAASPFAIKSSTKLETNVFKLKLNRIPTDFYRFAKRCITLLLMECWSKTPKIF